MVFAVLALSLLSPPQLLLAMRRGEAPQTFSCTADSQPGHNSVGGYVSAYASLAADGTIEYASSYAMMNAGFETPSFAIHRQLTTAALAPREERASIGYSDRRFRRGQRISFSVLASNGSLLLQSPLTRTGRQGFISAMISGDEQRVLLAQPDWFAIVVYDREGVAINRSVFRSADIRARLAERNAAEARLQAMIADYRNQCYDAAAIIIT